MNIAPEKFKKYLVKARNFVDENNLHPKLITINAWNEWSEGSYLEPDSVGGYGYLEVLKSVFIENER